MSADRCESRCGDVRCDEVSGFGEGDPHTFIAGKPMHWRAMTYGFFVTWLDDEEPRFSGPIADGLAALSAGLRALNKAWEASSVAIRFLLSALADPCADRIKVAPDIADVEHAIAFMHHDCGIPLDMLAYDPGPPARILCTPEPYPERIEIGPDVAALASAAARDAYQRICDACDEHTAGRLSDADLEAVVVDAASDVPLALLERASEPVEPS